MAPREDLGTAVLTLKTDATQFNAGLDAAERKKNVFKQSFSDIAKSLAGIGKDGKISLDTLGAAFANPTQGAKALGLSIGEGLAGGMGVATVAAVAVTGAIVAVGAAMVGLGMHAAAVGAELDDASEITGISVERLSSLKFAAQIAGVSLDTLTNGIFKMQQRMEESPDDFEKGLRAIGLTSKELEDLTLDEKFLAINEAFRATKPGAEQAAAAIALFGKQGRDIIPLLNEDLKGAVDRSRELGLVWSTEDAAAAEDLTRETAELHAIWSNLWEGLGNFFIPVLHSVVSTAADVVGALHGMWETVRLLWGEVRNVPTPKEIQKKLIQPGVKPVALSMDDADKIAKEQDAALKKQIDKQVKDAEAASKKITEARAKAAQRDRDLINELGILNMNAEAKRMDAMEDRETAERAMLNDINVGRMNATRAEMDRIDTEEEAWRTHLNWLGERRMEDAAAAIKASKYTSDRMKDIFKGIPGVLAQAFTGGGGLIGAIKAIGTDMGAALFDPKGGLGKSMSDGVSKLFGKDGIMGKIGGAISASLPVIGSLIGPAIQGLMKLFGKSEESAKVSPVRDEFFKLQGGLETLNPKVVALAGNLQLVEAVFKAKTVEQYNAAIANLTHLLEEPKRAMETLTETAQRYGFTLEELGPALQRQNLDEQAQQLFKDWEVLNAGQLDNVAITEHMSEAVNAYLADVRKVGGEVPIAMKPMLEAMAKHGELTDAAGNKIENLEDAGITFAMTMSEGFKTLIDEVKKLTNAIAVGLGLAIQNIPEPTVTVHARYDTSDLENAPDFNAGVSGDFAEGSARGSYVQPWGLQYLRTGGMVAALAALGFLPRGSDVVPAMLTPGEGVVNRLGMHHLGIAGLRALNQGERVAAIQPASSGGLDPAQLKAAVKAGLSDASPSLVMAPGAVQINSPLFANEEAIEKSAQIIVRGIGRYALSDFQRLKART